MGTNIKRNNISASFDNVFVDSSFASIPFNFEELVFAFLEL